MAIQKHPRYIQLPDGTRFDTKQRGAEWGYQFGYIDMPDFEHGGHFMTSKATGVNLFHWTRQDDPLIHFYEYRDAASRIEGDVYALDYTGETYTELKDGEYEIESMTIRMRR